MRRILLLAFLLTSSLNLFATGEASTYFNIFVPPNNNQVHRDVCLIVTAISDSTYFTITDDDADGDSDDSKSGMLMAGQSYILYIRENGINDDAPHPGEGTTKNDGDYFIVTASNLVLCSQSTNSDWQHDWVPATNKSSKGKEFIVFSPPTSYSNRDLNVFAYENDTRITLRKISTAPQLRSGLTNVDIESQEVVFQQTLNVGEDLIYYFTEGRDVLKPGETYVLEANKEVTMQYGALYKNARDGGGYVPSSNGSSAGKQYYFQIPFDRASEQELRIVSWEDNNEVTLSQYVNGSWQTVTTWTLDRLGSGDWVNYAQLNPRSVCRVEATGKVSVFEANWLETGSPGTSDIASMVSSEEGNTAGTAFLCYMAPPGIERNVRNPFTGELYNKATHLYIFSRVNAVVTVKDAGTNGQKINRTYNIEAGRYVDSYLDLQEWQSIYNGDGNPDSGPERPYLLVESDEPVSVLNTNFNDNWMAYLGTSLTKDFTLDSEGQNYSGSPGDTVEVFTNINISENQVVEQATAEVVVSDGATLTGATFTNFTTASTAEGTIQNEPGSNLSTVVFNDLGTLNASDSMGITTEVWLSANYKDNNPIETGTVVSISTIVSGNVNGVFQQARFTDGIVNNTDSTDNLLYSGQPGLNVVSQPVNSWSSSWGDYNNDGYDDLLVFSNEPEQPNRLYQNNGNGSFTAVTSTLISSLSGSFIAGAWGDYDNDGWQDLYLATNPDQADILLRNTGDGDFEQVNDAAIGGEKTYAHHVQWVDMDQDGYLDLFVSDYMPTRFSKAYQNNGDGTFTLVNRLADNAYSVASTWADYDNDGDPDLFIVNDKGGNNLLYRNNGNFTFERVTISGMQTGNNSTGAAWGDLNNDGLMDLMVANASNQANEVYLNNGNNSFTPILETRLEELGGNSHGVLVADVNEDGWQDIYFTNDQNEEKVLLINQQGSSFALNTQEVLISATGNTFGATRHDYDNDGDPDIFVSTHSEENDAFFSHNDRQDKWLGIRLTGTRSNASGYGARIAIKSTINGSAVWQYRDYGLSATSGQSAPVSLFGIGDATVVDSVLINWPSGFRQVLTGVNTNQYLNITEPNSSEVTGVVFNDKNGNCVQDAGEQPLPGMNVAVRETGVTLLTNKQGRYTAVLPTGNFTLEVLPQDNWAFSCQSTKTINVPDYGQVISGNGFGVSANVDRPDLSVEIGHTALRRGFSNTGVIRYRNTGGGQATDVTIELTVPEGITLLNAGGDWIRSGLHEYRFTLDTLPVGANGIINFQDSVGLSLTNNQLVSYQAKILLAEQDMNTTDNVFTLEENIVGAVDPNDMLVKTLSRAPENQLYRGEAVRYKIRFQNVGTWYASRVVVKSRVPEDLRLESLSDVVTSHEGQLRILPNRTLVWTFDDIMLPDSTTNEPASHGYISFTLRASGNLEEGTEIRNQASIYFDFEDPIVTNITRVRVINLPEDNFFTPQKRESMTLYPNPAEPGQAINVMWEDPTQQIKHVLVQDATGRTLYRASNQYSRQIVIEGMPSGLYTVHVVDNHDKAHYTRLVVP